MKVLAVHSGALLSKNIKIVIYTFKGFKPLGLQEKAEMGKLFFGRTTNNP